MKNHAHSPQARSDLIVRSLQPSDRNDIKRILMQPQFFSEEERAVAFELCECAIDDPEQKDYFFVVAEFQKKLAGYVCFGPRSLTDGTFDLYWIAVDPAYQKHGVGKLLMSWAENTMKKQGCRLVIVETSGRKGYEPTRKFYLKINYLEEARIKDFYKKGDDLVIYTKKL